MADSDVVHDMIHDPLCPTDGVGARFAAFGLVCDDCNLIARVRNDERAATLIDVEQAAEWTYRSDIINPVMDIIDALRSVPDSATVSYPT